MKNINRLHATLCLIRQILFPATDKERYPLIRVSAGRTDLKPDQFASALKEISPRLPVPGGRLELLFVAVLAPAAPFLLYHLKRNGFSDCRAVVTREGILVTARR
jgi:hypothetical protein